MLNKHRNFFIKVLKLFEKNMKDYETWEKGHLPYQKKVPSYKIDIFKKMHE